MKFYKNEVIKLFNQCSYPFPERWNDRTDIDETEIIQYIEEVLHKRMEEIMNE